MSVAFLVAWLLPLGCDSGSDELVGREELAQSPDSITERIVDLSAGTRHACVATADGALFCWGHGVFGQLGDGRAETLVGPTRVVQKTHFVSVAAGAATTCALDRDGRAWCWGLNLRGELGHDHADMFTPCEPCWPIASEPFLVDVELDATRIDTGGTSASFQWITCALDASGPVCWGVGSFHEPGTITGGRSLVDLAVGVDHACGLEETGRILCWGSNATGQLGVTREGLPTCGDLVPCTLVPVAAEADADFVEVSAGNGYTCGLDSNGFAWCWGRASAGQTGAGETADVTPPAPVESPVRFTQLSAGNDHACGVTEAGAVWCWGNAPRGILGTDPGPLPSCGPISLNKCSPVPVPVEGVFRFERVEAGSAFTCGLTPGGRILCWGDNSSGALGIGVMGGSEIRPVPVTGQR